MNKIITGFILSFLFIVILSLPKDSFSQVNHTNSDHPTAVTLDSTNLPIVFINTHWQFIPNEPKITADMGIIDHGYNQMNHISDPFNAYNGKIGIEKRGSISQLWPQVSYTMKTIDALGNSLNDTLLGMHKEHDWVLYAPYDDETMMRNVLTYKIGRQMGHWAPHARFCELVEQVFVPQYQGIYVLMEKIKRDANRVNIAKLDSNDLAGDSLTGGYIIAIDQNIWAADSGWNTTHAPNLYIKYVDPNGAKILPQQKNYIQAYVDSFELALLSPNFQNLTTGFRKYAEQNSFIDFFIMQELSKNVDAYKRSGYMYKDKASKGGKLIAGPFWDFNSAWYNIHACGFDADTGWAYPRTCWVNASYPVPFWWSRMLQDSIFTRDLKCRWTTLRSHYLDTAFVFHEIDSMANYISAAQVRHYAQWTITTNFPAEVDSLKLWFTKRMTWMDANMPGNCWNLGVGDANSISSNITIYPNPTTNEIHVDFFLNAESKIEMEVLDIVGRTLKVIPEKDFYAGKNSVDLDLSNLSAGTYFVKLKTGNSLITKKIMKTE